MNTLFTYKSIVRLPEWTKVNLIGDEEPPAPNDKLVHEMLDETGTRDHFNQPVVSPAVSQANEAGTLVQVRHGTEDYHRHGAYARTRHVASLGFDLTLDEAEFREERARLRSGTLAIAPLAFYS